MRSVFALVVDVAMEEVVDGGNNCFGRSIKDTV